MTASDNTIPTALLGWYDRHARGLPWRARPGAPAPDPYRVWLSEIMLQQTTVAAVKPYFEKFTATWPSVEALAAAPEEAVMAAWAGLGYYSRARNLLKAAREVAARGGFPESEAELRQLPGVGDYTAAAIAAIAFGQRAVVVDANVERVVSRLFAIDDPLPRARKAIRAATDTITPAGRAGDFAQAMMDLGSQVCTVRQPQCLLCPLASHCTARTLDPERFPVKPAKKARPVRQGRAFWIVREDAVWLVRRQGSGMLGGMRALPDDGWSARGDGHGEPPLPGEWASRGVVRHGFTHFEIELEVLACAGNNDMPGQGEWWPLERLTEAGLPTLFAKAAQRALAG
ncbi:A/G-specific adenine glycosylase [Erythrobacter sp. SDW2]|uniref:A/G-specific adenine glycosylase n=1 Tax=Erythrobacter sp. SDW2 TaxID=2907154 RepID=UPI001F3996CD|nr:A/G-specific adenine glycosylase [Erythrobacter sp. SDW2]UIP07990.1 A/G-specific adenine glycosylase [Erythrobacter sp. SDW2]